MKLPAHIQFVLQKYPETRVFRRFVSDGETVATKWYPIKDWYSNHKDNPTDYCILPNELILETDFEDLKENKDYYEAVTKPELEKMKWQYITCDAGNKSYHTHISFDQPITPYLRKSLVERIWGKQAEYDKQLYFDTHGIRFIGAKHPKTGRKKAIVDRNDNDGKINHYDFSTFPPERKKKFVIDPDEQTDLSHCLVMQRALRSKFPIGVRNTILVPNFLALKPTEEEMQKFVTAQGMEAKELTGWMTAACFRKSFNCKQVRYHYAEWELVCGDGSCPHYNKIRLERLKKR